MLICMNVLSIALIVSCFTMLVTVVDVSFAELPSISTTVRPMITFDKIAYTWTDKVYITILAPEYNLDSNKIDEIGNTVQNPIKIFTGNHTLDQYRLTETGLDTGVFVGEVTLTGFKHDADGDKVTGDENGYDTCPHTGDGNGRFEPMDEWGRYQCSQASDGNGTTVGLGPTNGFLENINDDVITLSFKFSEDEIVSRSAFIKWNVGKVQLLGPFYLYEPVMLRVIDPDMNLNSEFKDDFDIDVWSTSNTGGIDLTVRETGNATGIFEGTLFIDYNSDSGGRLEVSEGDIITAEYEDNTLPPPYDISDELYVEDMHVVNRKPLEPLKRVPITEFRIINGAGGIVGEAASGNPIYIIVDMKNDQHKINQEFIYIVQIEDANNEVVHIDVKSHSLLSYEESSLSTSWTPDMPGTHTVTVFIWDSIDNPIPLSPKMEKVILVIPALSEN